jgi:hypothetical protein
MAIASQSKERALGYFYCALRDFLTKVMLTIMLTTALSYLFVSLNMS